MYQFSNITSTLNDLDQGVSASQDHLHVAL
jgi:hypothetical protein